MVPKMVCVQQSGKFSRALYMNTKSANSVVYEIMREMRNSRGIVCTDFASLLWNPGSY